MKLTPLKITAIVIASLVGLILLTGICYLLYVVIDYERIGDNVSIDTSNNTTINAQVNTEYNIVTFNIGFGAYDHDFNFFMDSGELNGKKLKGKDVKAASKDAVIANTNGVISNVKDDDFDFLLFQEVDTDSTRSYHVNQYVMLADAFSINKDRGATFACDYNSPFFLYPTFYKPHGKSKSGLATFSRYKIDSNLRREYPVSDAFDKYFDLDRCFLISRIPVSNGKTLTIINSHMSAYDKGGTIRAKQLELLNNVLKEEKEAGNYVIVGGDFNHDITGLEEAKSQPLFETQQPYPSWIYCLTDEDLTDGYSFRASVISEDGKPCATCRSAEIPYTPGVNYLSVLDGFIVSDNIEVIKNVNIDADFKFSDHNPATMTFKLK